MDGEHPEIPAGRQAPCGGGQEAPILEGLLACTEAPGPSTWELPFQLPLITEH
jgi:hypothetical protein